MIEYSYDPPYNLWSGNRSDTLNKWKINYKGSIATASALPEKGEFKGDTYNVLEDGSNYMWNGKSWDKLDANVYVGATSTKDGIQGLVPPADSSERSKFLRGDGTYKDVAWDMIVGKPLTFTPSAHTHDWGDILNEPEFVLMDYLTTYYPYELSNTFWDLVGYPWPKTELETANKTFDSFIQIGKYALQMKGTDGNAPGRYSSTDYRTGVLSVDVCPSASNVSANPHILQIFHMCGFSVNRIFFRMGSRNTTTSVSWGSWSEVQKVSNSSDARLKTDIASVSDKLLDAWENVSFSQFRFKDNTQKLCIGVIAQDIISAFSSIDELDINTYNLVENETYYLEETSEEVNRYALRYIDLLCIEAAYQRRRAERAEARIKALEDRLEALEAKLA